MAKEIKNGMRVKHGTRIRFVLKSETRVLEDQVMPADQLDGHLTLCGIMYNRLAVSGGVSWWDPRDGATVTTPGWRAYLVNDSDELGDGELCDCASCKPEPAL